MPNTFTTKFRLCKPAVGSLDWYLYYYDAMNIVDAHIPRIFMSAPRVLTAAASAGGLLLANYYYFYKVVAVNGTLVTLASWEAMKALTDVTNKTVDITWSAVSGVTKYRVYQANTTDPSYIPLDTEYTLLAEVTGSTSYSDTGTGLLIGTLPTVPTWYTTEIDQLYVIPDATEGQAQHISPVTLVDNLDNIRYMINQINGQTNWDDALVTNLVTLNNGKVARDGSQALTASWDAGNFQIRSATIYADDSLVLSSGKKFYLDDGGDTYLYEQSPNRVDLVVGAQTVIQQTAIMTALNKNVSIEPIKKLYFDGGDDTYISEYAANNLMFYVGGVGSLQMTTTGGVNIVSTNADLALPATRKIFFDGGGDTYISEYAANNLRLYVGGAIYADIGSSVIQSYFNFIPASDNSISCGQSGNRWSTVYANALSITSVALVTNLNADLLDSQHGAYYLARGNHTGTQPISTLSDHNKANHDALGLNASTLGSSTLAQVIVSARTAVSSLYVETRTGSDPGSPVNGQIWLRTDL